MEESTIRVGTVFKLGYPFDDWDEEYKVVSVDNGVVEVVWNTKHVDDTPAIYPIEEVVLYFAEDKWVKI